MLKPPLVGVVRVNFSQAPLKSDGTGWPDTEPPSCTMLLQPGPKSSAAFGLVEATAAGKDLFI